MTKIIALVRAIYIEIVILTKSFRRLRLEIVSPNVFSKITRFFCCIFDAFVLYCFYLPYKFKSIILVCL